LIFERNKVPVFPLDQCPIAPPDVTIENAQFVYSPNFEGREEQFNDPGDRYFNLRIPDDLVKHMEENFWNLSWTKPRKNATPQEIAEHVPEPFVKVAVGFTYRPPFISVWEDGKETVLGVDERGDTAKIIDKLQFEKMDVVIRGNPWKNTSGCGIKAWLKTFVGVVESDDIRRKYANMRGSEED